MYGSGWRIAALLTEGQLSHNERLKNCADPENNNLYVSNLPKVMTENVRVLRHLLVPRKLC